MSEYDSGSGSSGRKGFVHDVMRRISSSGTRTPESADPSRDRGAARPPQDEGEDLQDAMRVFGTDSEEFRRRLDRMLAEFEALRRRYQLTREQCADAERQNERLVGVLQEAKQQIELLKEEVDKLCAPPNTYGIFNRAEQGRHGGDPRRRPADARQRAPEPRSVPVRGRPAGRAQRGVQRRRAVGLHRAAARSRRSSTSSRTTARSCSATPTTSASSPSPSRCAARSSRSATTSSSTRARTTPSRSCRSRPSKRSCSRRSRM